jgi:predicted signal transduction protein with EAL and GGDEF domain
MKRPSKLSQVEEKPSLAVADGEAILQVKVWLTGISPMIWRRVLVPATFTLRELHRGADARHRCSRAMEVAERIRQSIASLNIAHIGTPAGYVTVSIGCAVLQPSIGDTEMSLVALADKALYDAKNAGRNRVHIPA